MSRWYDENGMLIDGADVRAARKHKLYGSGTTIIDQLKKEGLDIWKLDQAILSAITFPRPADI